MELKLSDDERTVLERCVRRGTTAQRLALRARIVLLCADGLENKKVARRLRTSANTVGKWRTRFVEARLDGLLDEPRPGWFTGNLRESGVTFGRRITSV